MERAEQRKYAKLCILKNYDLLTSIYKRYCKIARDTQWMTLFGWMSVWRDCGMIRRHGDEERFVDIFQRVYQYHHEHLHNARSDVHRSRHSISQSAMYGEAHLHDKDPWTGMWTLQKYRKRAIISSNLLALPSPTAATITPQTTTLILPDDADELNAASSSSSLSELESATNTRTNQGLQTVNVQNNTHLNPHNNLHVSRPSHSHQISLSLSFMSSVNSLSAESAESLENEQYKFRKIGDRKIIGLIAAPTSNSKRFIVSGWLNRTDFKKAKLEVKSTTMTTTQRKDKWVYQLTLIPPDSMDDPLEMKMKWEHTKIGSAGSKSGVIRLFKLDSLDDDDVDLPVANYVGLSRHEFFDALLCVAQSTDCCDGKELYLLFDELIQRHLNEYIFKTMVDLRRFLKGKEIESELHDRLHSDSALIRLFKKYAALQKESQNMEQDAWCAMAEDLYSTAKQLDADTWKCGGRPTEDQLVQCFTLSKPAQSMDEQWIDLGEFIRCLLHFTAALFRAQPDAKYQVMSLEAKLDLVLKWCHKMDAQTGSAQIMSKRPSMRQFRSHSLSMIKQRRKESLSGFLGTDPVIAVLKPGRSSTTNVSPGSPGTTTNLETIPYSDL